MKIELAPEAVADLAALVEYLHERNPQAAVTAADGIFAVIDRLAGGEFEGPECELRRTRERVRSWPARPYRIYYRRNGYGSSVICVSGSNTVGSPRADPPRSPLMGVQADSPLRTTQRGDLVAISP